VLKIKPWSNIRKINPITKEQYLLNFLIGRRFVKMLPKNTSEIINDEVSKPIADE